MQMAVVEYARHVLGLTGAHTSEVDPNTPYPVIDLMPDQQHIDEKGGTMRLGKYPCRLSRDSVAFAAYGEENIFERHRHRYEFNNAYRDLFVEGGMRIGGVNPERAIWWRSSSCRTTRGSSAAVSPGAEKPPEPSAAAVPRVCRRGAEGAGKIKKENRRYAKKAKRRFCLIYENLFAFYVKRV